jgi:F0F1-type ATP synthase membrane subunit a
LSLLLGLIQALVFSLLTTVYLSLMLPHDDHHEAHAH